MLPAGPAGCRLLQCSALLLVAGWSLASRASVGVALACDVTDRKLMWIGDGIGRMLLRFKQYGAQCAVCLVSAVVGCVLMSVAACKYTNGFLVVLAVGLWNYCNIGVGDVTLLALFTEHLPLAGRLIY